MIVSKSVLRITGHNVPAITMEGDSKGAPQTDLTVSVLCAAKYKSSQPELVSMLLFSTLALAITVPAALWLSS
ncbi:MAG TPA: hypothetical protein VHU83_10855 [Bryobacteraceae bacterium]|jgi:hypothetical protein|nr:hypothetical protein [Bryobacteraceae bacterium]